MLSSVQNWYELGHAHYGFGVPRRVLTEIQCSDATEEEKKDVMLLYFLNNVPMASWSIVAGALYWRSERAALHAVKPFLTIATGAFHLYLRTLYISYSYNMSQKVLLAMLFTVRLHYKC